MKSPGDRLNLDFEVKFVKDGLKESALLSELITGLRLISVYMRNNTASCDKQMISLSHELKAIRTLGCSVIGISKDTVGSHLKYAEKHSIRFPLVSDPKHQFATAMDSLIEKKMYGRTFWGPMRSAYLIDENDVLLGICKNVDPAHHGAQVLSLLGDR